MELSSTELTVPAGEAGLPDTIINLSALLAEEARQDEVQSVTPTKAPELLTALNRAWREIHKVVTKLEADKRKAEKAADKRKGVLLLEVIPKRLEELRITTAADIRKAVIDTDEEYLALTDRFDQIVAAVAFLKGKLKAFEQAFSSVKKIMGDDAYNMAAGRNTKISGDTTVRVGSLPLTRSATAPLSDDARKRLDEGLQDAREGRVTPVPASVVKPPSIRSGFGQSRY